MSLNGHLGARLDAYLDNELSLEGSLGARAHLDGCPRCQRAYSSGLALRAVLRRALPASGPRPEFLRQLAAAVRRADAGPRRRRHLRLASLGSAALAAALLLVFGLPLLPAQSGLVDEVVAAHLRSLQAEHLLDVPSSDTHTVKPWFSGKLPFSLPVRDFGARGFPLAGGRLDYLAGRPVAALVYRSGRHTINVLVWPVEQAASSPVRRESQAGLHILHWVSGGMAWWAVSDVNVQDLQRLAALLQEPEP